MLRSALVTRCEEGADLGGAGLGDVGEDFLNGAHEGGGVGLGEEEAFDEMAGDGEAGVLGEDAMKLRFPIGAGGEEEAVGGEVGGKVFAVEGESESLEDRGG